MYDKPQTARIYGIFWEKYRPPILNLMTATSKGPQNYKFSSHEFRDISKKTGYSFVLRVFEGKALNDIKRSILAQDLLYMLQNSERASELVMSDIYEFELDKKFVLHIKREIKEESN